MKRFELTKSARQGWWVLKDSATGISVEFEQGKFNETQKVSFPDSINIDNPAKVMSEIGDWLFQNAYFIAMPVDSQACRAYFAKMIRDKREELGWTVYKLSKESGVKEFSIHNIESGKFDLRGETLIKLISSMGCKIDINEFK